MRNLCTLGILEVYMGSNIDPLFVFLASDPVGLLFTIPEISNDKLHPLHNVLLMALEEVEPEFVQLIMEDSHFCSLNNGMNFDDFEREARIECLRRIFDEKILVQRCAELVTQSGKERPAPYNHEVLIDVQVDEDYLVPLTSFSNKYGPLRRNGYAFGVVPPVPSVNSAYWFMEVLRRPGICEKASVRLDPFLNREDKDFPDMVYRAWWYGLPMNWERIKSLTQEEHRRAGPDELTRRDILYTDLVWSPRGNEVHFICEEIPTDNSLSIRGSRYFHAIYNPNEEVFIHIDGAVRFFTKDEWIKRKDAHVRDIGKIGKRVKIFKLEGLFSKEVFTALLPSFFVWNMDIYQYFKDMC